MYDHYIALPSHMGSARPTFAVRCGMPALERLIIQRLEHVGFQPDPHANVVLLVDAPYGFALVTLETLDQTQRHVIVATENACPEYWDDLLSFQPTILLTGRNWEHEIAAAIRRVAQGEQYRIMPHHTSPLTERERKVLRYVARAWTNQQIANLVGVSEGTVGNMLTSIYGKVGVDGRVAVALYYWGRQDLLGTVPPPKHP